MLIIFSGLPGVGKTTIARTLASKRRAAYVRVDEIEQALNRCGDPAVGAKGYAVANAIASSNLRLGLEVVADSVNPVEESRKSWRAIATTIGVSFAEVEIICTDQSEHRRRVETRLADIDGHEQPSWDAVRRHNYMSWTSDRIIVDTARLDVEQAVAKIEQRISLSDPNRNTTGNELSGADR